MMLSTIALMTCLGADTKPKTIDIIAPSSAASLERVERGRRYLKDKGFDTDLPNDLLSHDSPYEANTRLYKLKHLQRAAQDDSVAIWSIRGGYSSTKLAEEVYKLPYLPQKKFIVGLSDITALFGALNGRHGWLCIYGAGITQIPKNVDPRCIELILEIIDGKIHTLAISNLTSLNSAAPRGGKLVGGNLSILETTIGTDWEINCRGKILFLEDISEDGYKIDRMLTHLKQSHMLDGVEAIVFGQFSPPIYKPDEAANIHYALSKFANSMDCPVYKTSSFGHGYESMPMVIGSDAEIIVNESSSTLQFTWQNFENN